MTSQILTMVCFIVRCLSFCLSVLIFPENTIYRSILQKTTDIRMTPHDQGLPPIITLDASSPELGNSPTSPMPTPTKTRVLYCRKCEGHGEKVILKNHAPSCPYILCTCRSVSSKIFMIGLRIRDSLGEYW